MKSLHIILAIVLLIGSATALTAQTAPPETGKVVVENDEFKPEIEIKMTRTALDSGTSFTLEIKKDKKPMDEFTRAMIADTAPVIVQFYFAGRDTPVSVGEAGAVNFIADGKQVTGGELRRVDYTFSSFKTKKIDDPILIVSIGTLKQLAEARAVKAKIAGTVYELPRPLLNEFKRFVNEYLK